MSRDLWTDAYLDRMRQEADPEADAVMREVFARHHFKDLMRYIGSLSAPGGLPEDIPREIAGFVAATASRPAWASGVEIDAQVERAEHFFYRHGIGGLLTLVCASLPECYTMHKGVRILGLTRQLGDHTDRRLHQTLLMVLAVMQPGGLAAGGAGVQQAQRVRLIHAAIRRMVHLGLSASDPAHPPAPAGDSPVPPEAIAAAMLREGFHWNVEADGQPINQEDLAFTLLTFGYVIPLGMSRFGVPVKDTDRLAFLQAWNVAGSYLGIRRELMAETVEDAEWLFAKIKSRQAAPTSDGAFLTSRLVDFLAQDVIRLRLLRPLAPTLIRAFAGDDTARMLGLDARHSAGLLVFHKVIVRLVRGVNTLGRVLGRFHPFLHLGDALGRRVIEALSRYTARGETARLAVPTDWLRAAQSLIANR